MTLGLSGCGGSDDGAPDVTGPPGAGSPPPPVDPPPDPDPVPDPDPAPEPPATPFPETQAAERGPEAQSFAGEMLYGAPVDAQRITELETAIAALQASDSLTEDEYIELGRLYISANRFRDAIRVYTRGLEAYPESFKLRRHRGHRYLNVRELEPAIADLEAAITLIGDEHADVLEYDENGEPTGTYEHWTYYHIGLYHYLNQDWTAAAEAYEQSVATATTNQALVGASDWLYNAYQKAGLANEAAAVIATIPADLDTNQDHPYFKRMLVYKGEAAVAEVLDVDKPIEEWTGADITVGYGVANWYAFNGNPQTAEQIHRTILQTPYWNAWAWVTTDKAYQAR